MKKYHLYLWIIALVGLMTSCSQDETDALPTDTNANRVTLTASLPADFAQPQPRSRALPAAPANHKLRCILEVWDTETTPSLKIRQEICPNAGDTEIDFSFELATTGTYKALLWADYIPTNQGTSTKEIAGLAGVSSYGDNYYTTTNGLKEVEISLTLPTTYPEAGDAFYTNTEFTKAEKALTIPTVTLTRPFMKLTIAEKNAERFASCNQVTVRFNTLYKFDVATGNATGTTNFGLPAANGTRNYGTDITIGGKTCKTLICLYLFANAADGTMGDIKLEFTSSEQGKSLPAVTIPAGIPLKRNYRVNAAGNLIGEPSSSTVNMTVDINSDWTTPDEEYDADKAKVGDYYYEDGTWSTAYDNQKTCIGIVYEVSADGKSGKIMGLTQTNSEKWSTENIETGANNPTDGRANMTTIANLIANSGGSKSWDNYPVFKWVTEQNNNTGNWDATTDKWYLPAKDELSTFYTAHDTYGKDNFNAKITTAGGTALSNIYFYPSSTENSSTNYWYTDFSNGNTSTQAKTYNVAVRCIRVF